MSQRTEKSEADDNVSDCQRQTLNGILNVRNEIQMNQMESILFFDGNINLAAMYRNYLLQCSRTELLIGLELEDGLADNKNPLEKMKGTRNVCQIIYVCFVWEKILMTQFMEPRIPTEFLKATLLSYVDEMYEYLGPQVDALKVFTEFANFTNQNGLKDYEKSNWYDVPPLLRLIGTTHICISQAGSKGAKSHMTTTMKALPQGTIMMIWKKYELENRVEDLKTANDVSKWVGVVCLDVKFKNLTVFHLVFPLCVAGNMDVRK